MQKIAIIDIGSNSARLVISTIFKNGAYKMFFNQKESLRLGQKVDGSNKLTEEAILSTIETIKNFSYMSKVYKVDETIAVATAAIRNSANGQELVDRVKEATGVQLEIISGIREAYLSYMGVINTLNIKSGIIFDLGGGSTEIVLFKNRKLVESVSIPIGAVNTTDMFNTRDSMSPQVLEIVETYIKSKLNDYPWLKQNNLPLIAVGTHDMVIAATPDGILVSDKEKSSLIKDHVDKARPMHEARPWGHYSVLYSGQGSLTKHLIITPNQHISYQYHNHRTEMWTFIEGEGELILDGKVSRVSKGDNIVIPSGTKHAIKALDNELHIIEVQIGEFLVEEDIGKPSLCTKSKPK